MKKISSTALVRLCDAIQPPAGEYLRDTPLYHLVYQDIVLYCKKINDIWK